MASMDLTPRDAPDFCKFPIVSLGTCLTMLSSMQELCMPDVPALSLMAHRCALLLMTGSQQGAHSMALPMQARSRRSVAGKDIMLDPRAGIRKAGAMPPAHGAAEGGC